MKIKKKETIKKVAIGCGTVIGVVAVCYICDKLFGNHKVVECNFEDPDFTEFWLKDGTNVFVHTFDGKIDQVEFNHQSFDTLIEAATELKEFAKDIGYDTAQEFEHVVFSSYDD